MNSNDKKKAPKRAMAKTGRKAARSVDGQARQTSLQRTPASGMSPTLQAHIGRHVRAVFDEVAQEPIPDHLLRLLKDLDQSGEK